MGWADLRQWWRARVGPGESVPERTWTSLCRDAPLLRRHTAAERARLRKLTEAFLRRKDLRGAQGLHLAPEMRLAVAAQACVPVLNLGIDWYAGWISVIVHPGEFVARHRFADDAGVVHDVEVVQSGEAWERGPVVLSWRDVEDGIRGHDGGNVVIHEMAHKLDGLNGSVNGMPPLHPDMERASWTRAFMHAFDDFTRRTEDGWHFAHGRPLPFDEYAAENPGEFFAVASEAFFVDPAPLASAYPRVYAQLRAFYRQDPAAGAASADGPPDS